MKLMCKVQIQLPSKSSLCALACNHLNFVDLRADFLSFDLLLSQSHAFSTLVFFNILSCFNLVDLTFPCSQFLYDFLKFEIVKCPTQFNNSIVAGLNCGHFLHKRLRISFIIIHGRFEPDMLAFSGCYFGGGEKERHELGEIRKRWTTLPVRLQS